MLGSPQESFRCLYDLKQRKQFYLNKQQVYPNKVLVVLEKKNGSQKVPNLKTNMIYVVDHSQIFLKFKHQITSDPTAKNKNEIILFYIMNQIPQADRTMGQLEQEYASQEDGFLYIQYALQDSFGSIRILF